MKPTFHQMSCKNCDFHYIGQINQRVMQRITQHNSDVNRKPNACRLTNRRVTTSHVADFDEPNLHKISFLEICHISSNNGQVLNETKDIDDLSVTLAKRKRAKKVRG